MKSPDNMRGVDRMVAVLRSFSQTRPLLSLVEVAALADLDKNTARRILLALCQTDLVRRDEQSGLYGLDIGVMKMQPAVLGPRQMRETAAPYLQRLSTAIGMTSFFWTADSEGAICIERARASDVFLDVPWSTPGTVVPLNMASGPRVVLAYLDAAVREAWLARPQQGNTQFSQTDPQMLRDSAIAIRARGYELISNDYFIGLTGLGMPVFDRFGTFVGAVSITSLCSEFEDEARLAQAHAALREAASDIGVRMGPAFGPRI